ncbi:MAG: ParB/RepB/Spo0J family partition protein [Bdellovibrionota bacterium]
MARTKNGAIVDPLAPERRQHEVVGEVLLIAWQRIRPFAGQPREYFDQEELESLARGIRAAGQRVPIEVRVLEDDPEFDFELIDGQRRLHAVQIAGIATIRAVLGEVKDEEEQFERSVIANFCRSGHTTMEISNVCERFRRRGRSQMEIADRIGKSIGYVGQYLSLQLLEPSLQLRLHPQVPRKERLTLSAALLIVGSEPEDHAAQLELAAKLEGKTIQKQRVEAARHMQIANPAHRAAPAIGPAYGAGGQGRKRKPSDTLRVARTFATRVIDEAAILNAKGFGKLFPTETEDAIRMRDQLDRAADAILALRNSIPGSDRVPFSSA